MHLSYFSKHVVKALLLVVISAAFTACGDRGGDGDDGGTTGTRPTASAGADQTVDADELVTLNGGNSSDPQDLPLTYAWEQLEGPTVTLSAADTVRATFTAPSLPSNSTLTFALTVDNGTANDIDTVVVTVNDDTNNLTPTANAGSNQTVVAGDAVSLDGSASSGNDGGALTYSWVQISGDSVVLVEDDQAIVTFTAPAVSETTQLRFSLIVSSGDLADSDNVLVTVNPVPDTTSPTILTRSPIPGATGVNRSTTVTVGFDEAMLESSIDNTTFRLRRGTTDTAGTFGYDASANELTFTPTANLTGNRLYTLLIDGITDLAGNSVAPAQWTFTTSANAGPNVVVTNPDQFVTRGSTVTLDASGSTDDLTPANQLRYLWVQTAGSPVALSSATAARPNFFTDTLDIETLVFSVTVTDGDGISSTLDNVYVTLLENAANALFVSSTAGDDANDGTREEPFKSIASALTLANAASPRLDIYATTGSYAEATTLAISSDVSVYGSYDDSFHRVLDEISVPGTVINGARTAVTANTITSPTYLDLVDIRASTSITSGVNSVGVAVIDSNFATPRFIILRSDISGGIGGNGADGENSAPVADGVSGLAGLSGADTDNAGPAVISTCGLGDSGAGGLGQRRDGDNGAVSVDGVAGGAGGTQSDTVPARRDGEPGGSIATTLAPGAEGAVGPATGSIAGDTWQPSSGAAGSDGAGGASGGGGGGGAGFNNDAPPDDRGGGGGSGGTGGCPGFGGTGGQGGSGSFAVILTNSTIEIQDSVLRTGDGGDGGSSGAGSSGGTGGSGGAGGAGQGQAGSGGSGGDGQAGSAGGAGGVGAGGPSICMLGISGSTLPIAGFSCVLGSPGEPGVPAVGGAAGQQGLSSPTFELGG